MPLSHLLHELPSAERENGGEKCYDPNYSDTFKIISDLSGKVLDVWQENTEDGAQIVQYDYHGGTNQLIRCFLLG
jgi:Ricin-type beta-trefoil lectin domain-like